MESVGIHVRTGRPSDHDALLRIERETWHPQHSPAPGPLEGPFFSDRAPAEAHLVAETESEPVGWLRFGHPTPLPASAHVWVVQGLAVTPRHQGHGVARTLLHELLARAQSNGIRKIGLRVLSTNEPARTLYASCGFVVEGVLADEFLIDGRFVDDVLMAVVTGADAAPPA